MGLEKLASELAGAQSEMYQNILEKKPQAKQTQGLGEDPLI